MYLLSWWKKSKCPWCAAIWSHVDVWGPCCHLRQCLCLWPLLKATIVPVTYAVVNSTLMSMVCAATRNYVEVQWYMLLLEAMWISMIMLPESRRSLWSVLPLTIKGREASCAMVLMTANSWLELRDIDGFYDNISFPAPPPKETV